MSNRWDAPAIDGSISLDSVADIVERMESINAIVAATLTFLASNGTLHSDTQGVKSALDELLKLDEMENYTEGEIKLVHAASIAAHMMGDFLFKTFDKYSEEFEDAES